MAAALVIALAALVAAAALLAYRYVASPLSRIPGPTYYGLLGALPQLRRDPPCIPHLRWAKQFGGVVAYRTFNRRVLVTDPQAVRRVLFSKTFGKPKMSFLERIVGHGLLTAEGAQHTRQRMVVSPAFRYENLAAFCAVFGEQALVLSEKWRDLAQRTRRNVHPDFIRLTMDVIGLTAFGYSFDSQHEDDAASKNEVLEAYKSLFKTSGLSFTSLLIYQLPGGQFLPLARNREINKAIAVIRRRVTAIIESKRQRKLSSTGRRDILDLMLEAEANAGAENGAHSLTEEELVDNVMTFLVAGHETSAVALSWALLLLARHPDETKRLREECAPLLQGQPPNHRQLASLPYLAAVVREVLRLYPPVPLTMRVALADEELAGHRIPAGTLVFLSPLVMGRLRHLWGAAGSTYDMDEFHPERFLLHEQKLDQQDQAGAEAEITSGTSTSEPVNTRNRRGRTDSRSAQASNSSDKCANSAGDRSEDINPMAWLPFLAGPRSCIGSRFAQLEIQVVLATLIQHFDFAEPSKEEGGCDVQPKLAITMRPYPECPVLLTPL